MEKEKLLEQKTNKLMSEVLAICKSYNASITISQGSLVFLDSNLDDKGREMVMHTYFVAEDGGGIKIEYPDGKTGITVKDRTFKSCSFCGRDNSNHPLSVVEICPQCLMDYMDT